MTAKINVLKAAYIKAAKDSADFRHIPHRTLMVGDQGQAGMSYRFELAPSLWKTPWCQSNDREDVEHWIVRSHPLDGKISPRVSERRLNATAQPGGEERKNEELRADGVAVPQRGVGNRLQRRGLQVPDRPMRPFLEGDGTGGTLKASRRVFERGGPESYLGRTTSRMI